MSRTTIRSETDNFINKSQRSSSYLIDRRSASPQFPSGIQTTEALKKAIEKEHPALTGVIEPSLPMTLSIPDIDGHRLRITLLINPENMNHGKTNTVGAVYTRKGWITQAWGPNQDILTANGRTVAFMVDGIGMTTFFRRQSFGYLNFMALMNTYKNNGYRMFDLTRPRFRDNTRVISTIYGVEITYDNQVIMGHFNNFTLDEAAENPFLFNYNFEFVCSSNSDSYEELRGHFIALESINNPKTYIPVEEDPSIFKINSTDNQSKTLQDAKESSTKTPVSDAKPRDEQKIYKIWEAKTGLPWSEAHKRKYTDGTYNKNMRLRGTLLEKTWPFEPSEVEIL